MCPPPRVAARCTSAHNTPAPAHSTTPTLAVKVRPRPSQHAASSVPRHSPGTTTCHAYLQPLLHSLLSCYMLHWQRCPCFFQTTLSGSAAGAALS
jgi:hypothetical protein